MGVKAGILGVVMTTEEVMGKFVIPMETGSVTMETMAGNSVSIVIGQGNWLRSEVLWDL